MAFSSRVVRHFGARGRVAQRGMRWGGKQFGKIERHGRPMPFKSALEREFNSDKVGGIKTDRLVVFAAIPA
jgi:hypothetical protein